MPTLAGNKHFSVHFSAYGPRIFHLSTGKSTVRSVGNGHESGYSRANTIKKNINKDQRYFHTGNKYYNTLGKNFKVWGNEFYNIKDAASIKTTVWNKLGVFPSPFHVSTSSGLTLAGAFRGGYVAACSTAFRSATEENDSGGYLDAPCPSKVKQHSSTADWLKF